MTLVSVAMLLARRKLPAAPEQLALPLGKPAPEAAPAPAAVPSGPQHQIPIRAHLRRTKTGLKLVAAHQQRRRLVIRKKSPGPVPELPDLDGLLSFLPELTPGQKRALDHVKHLIKKEIDAWIQDNDTPPDPADTWTPPRLDLPSRSVIERLSMTGLLQGIGNGLARMLDKPRALATLQDAIADGRPSGLYPDEFEAHQQAVTHRIMHASEWAEVADLLPHHPVPSTREEWANVQQLAMQIHFHGLLRQRWEAWDEEQPSFTTETSRAGADAALNLFQDSAAGYQIAQIVLSGSPTGLAGHHWGQVTARNEVARAIAGTRHGAVRNPRTLEWEQVPVTPVDRLVAGAYRTRTQQQLHKLRADKAKNAKFGTLYRGLTVHPSIAAALQRGETATIPLTGCSAFSFHEEAALAHSGGDDRSILLRLQRDADVDDATAFWHVDGDMSVDDAPDMPYEVLLDSGEAHVVGAKRNKKGALVVDIKLGRPKRLRKARDLGHAIGQAIAQSELEPPDALGLALGRAIAQSGLSGGQNLPEPV